MLGEECKESACVLNVYSYGDVVLQQKHLEMIQVHVCCGPLLQLLVLPWVLCSSSEEYRQQLHPSILMFLQSLGHLWSCRMRGLGRRYQKASGQV